jgi:hypothetical protein
MIDLHLSAGCILTNGGVVVASPVPGRLVGEHGNVSGAEVVQGVEMSEIAAGQPRRDFTDMDQAVDKLLDGCESAGGGPGVRVS